MSQGVEIMGQGVETMGRGVETVKTCLLRKSILESLQGLNGISSFFFFWTSIIFRLTSLVLLKRVIAVTPGGAPV